MLRTLKAIIPTLLLTILFFLSHEFYGQQLSAKKLYENGLEEYSAGNYEVAIGLFSKCLVSDPALAEAYVARASSREQLKDFMGALTDYSIAVELMPESYDARLGRANVFYKLERYEEANADYKRLLYYPQSETSTVYFQKSASPSGTMQITTAQSNFAPVVFNYLALTEIKLGNFNQAIEWLDSAIQMHPGEADYYVNRGMARQKKGDIRAAEDFDRALKINPHHTGALAALALTNSSKEKSEDYLKQAIESDSTALYPILERGYKRMEEGNYSGALEDYNRALKLENKDPEIWLNRGYAREKLADLNGAYGDYTNAIKLREDYSQAWVNRGNVLQKMKRYSEAMEDYTIAVTFDLTYGAAYYNRAVVREKLNMKSESCADLKMAESLGVTIDPRLKAAVCPQ